MKTTLRQKAEEQESLIRTLRVEIQYLKDDKASLQETLIGILKPTSSYKLSWAEIEREIISLKERVSVEGTYLPMIDRAFKEENAKLWYLIRVAMHDKLIEEPLDIQKDSSRFDKPNFDN